MTKPRDFQGLAIRWKYPLVERNGEISLELNAVSALDVDPRRGLGVRVDGTTMEVTAASPYAIRQRLASGLKKTAKGVAVDPGPVAIADVRGLRTAIDVKADRAELPGRGLRDYDVDADTLGGTSSASILGDIASNSADISTIAADVATAQTDISNLSGADAALNDRVTTLEGNPIMHRESGRITLDGANPVKVTSALVTSDNSTCTIILTRIGGPGMAPCVEDGTITDNESFYVYSVSGDTGDVLWSVIA